MEKRPSILDSWGNYLAGFYNPVTFTFERENYHKILNRERGRVIPLVRDLFKYCIVLTFGVIIGILNEMTACQNLFFLFSVHFYNMLF